MVIAYYKIWIVIIYPTQNYWYFITKTNEGLIVPIRIEQFPSFLFSLRLLYHKKKKECQGGEEY